MIALVTLLAASAPLIAEGAQEQQSSGSAPAVRRPYAQQLPAAQLVSVKGKLELSVGRPKLNGEDGKEYELMYPYMLAEDVDIDDGAAISVSGYLVPGPAWNQEGDELHLRVEKVTVGDKVYDLSKYTAQTGPGYGPRSGMGGYGPGSYGPGRAGGYGPGQMGPGGRGPGMHGGYGPGAYGPGTYGPNSYGPGAYGPGQMRPGMRSW
jgi:hypothetical protein